MQKSWQVHSHKWNKVTKGHENGMSLFMVFSARWNAEPREQYQKKTWQLMFNSRMTAPNLEKECTESDAGTFDSLRHVARKQKAQHSKHTYPVVSCWIPIGNDLEHVCKVRQWKSPASTNIKKWYLHYFLFYVWFYNENFSLLHGQYTYGLKMLLSYR